MTSASGSVNCDGTRLLGTFVVDGSPRYLSVDVKPRSQSFKCDNATLTYGNLAHLLGECRWSGPIGKDELRIDFGEGATIVAQLSVVMPSSRQSHGTGTWSTVKPTLPQPPANKTQRNAGNVTTNTITPHDSARSVASLKREEELLKSGVPIIALFGQSGTGKSTFINLITAEQQEVGMGLDSCTRDVNVVAATVGGKSIVVIDTPGIDNTRTDVKETDIFAKIATFLRTMGERKIYVTGVLFLHRISDNRFSHTAQRISAMFKSLCGDAAMPHLMLCGTMRDKVSPQKHNDALDELYKIEAWKEMMDMGASTATMSNIGPNAKSDAERIVGELIKHVSAVELAVQHEMVTEARKADDTSAGRVLDADQKKQDESEKRVKETVKQTFLRRKGCVIQ